MDCNDGKNHYYENHRNKFEHLAINFVSPQNNLNNYY